MGSLTIPLAGSKGQDMDNLTLVLFGNGTDNPEETHTIRVISLFSVILGVSSIILNIIFLIVMRFLNDHSTAYHQLMQNLAIADLLASQLFLLTRHFPSGPFAHMTRGNDFVLREGLPYVFRSMPWMFFTGYLFTLTCLTIHQYVAVCKPWKYSQFGTKKMVRAALLVVWLFSSLQVIVPVVVLLWLSALSDKVAAKRALYDVSRVEMLIWMIIFAFTSILNIILDAVVYRKIKKLKLKRRNHRIPNQDTMNIQMKQEAFITVTLLLLACIFCRLPFPLFSIVGLELGVAGTIDDDITTLMSAVIVLLLFINFFADPIVYMLRMQEVRRCMKAMCHICIPCSKQMTDRENVVRSRLLLCHKAEITETMMTDLGGSRRGNNRMANEMMLNPVNNDAIIEA